LGRYFAQYCSEQNGWPKHESAAFAVRIAGHFNPCGTAKEQHFAVLAVVFSTEQYSRRFAVPHAVYCKNPQLGIGANRSE
jgi:hypothetical protein